MMFLKKWPTNLKINYNTFLCYTLSPSHCFCWKTTIMLLKIPSVLLLSFVCACSTEEEGLQDFDVDSLSNDVDSLGNAYGTLKCNAILTTSDSKKTKYYTDKAEQVKNRIDQLPTNSQMSDALTIAQKKVIYCSR